MEELDLLKKHWKTQSNFDKKSKEELQAIIKKSSSSTLKWMIVANFIELLIFITIGLLFSNPNEKINLNLNSFLEAYVGIYDYIIISFPIIFSIIYYLIIRKIQITSTISDLIKSILQARKLLTFYIYTNIILFISIIFIAITYSYEIIKENQIKDTTNNLSENALFYIQIFSTFITVSLFILAIWLFYKILYGRFIKRLRKNYNDLIS